MLADVLNSGGSRGNRSRRSITGRSSAGGSARLLAALHVCGGCRDPHTPNRGGRPRPGLLAAVRGDGPDHRSTSADVLAALRRNGTDCRNSAAAVLATVLARLGRDDSVTHG